MKKIVGTLALFVFCALAANAENVVPFKKVQLFRQSLGIVKDYVIQKQVFQDAEAVFDLTVLDAKTVLLHSVETYNGKANEIANRFEYDVDWAGFGKDPESSSFTVRIWFNDTVAEAYCFSVPKDRAGKYIKSFVDPGNLAIWCEFGAYRVLE
jgi:hypothetical protein